MKNNNAEGTAALYAAMACLESADESRRFLTDLCTETELKSMAQRMQVALMLREKRPYSEIAAATGASTATISRVNKCVTKGTDGYNLVISRMKNITAGEK